MSDAADMLEMVKKLKALAGQLEPVLKESALREVAAGGGLVIVRSEWFLVPQRARKGESGSVDPWFSLTQWEWDAEIEAGFDGWRQLSPRKRQINYDAARAWFAERLRCDQERRKAS